MRTEITEDGIVSSTTGEFSKKDLCDIYYGCSAFLHAPNLSRRIEFAFQKTQQNYNCDTVHAWMQSLLRLLRVHAVLLVNATPPRSLVCWMSAPWAGDKALVEIKRLEPMGEDHPLQERMRTLEIQNKAAARQKSLASETPR
jgi:hypothetical protein